jgi:hypothetical protein
MIHNKMQKVKNFEFTISSFITYIYLDLITILVGYRHQGDAIYFDRSKFDVVADTKCLYKSNCFVPYCV